MDVNKKVNYIRQKLGLPDEMISVNAGSWGPLCRAARSAIAEGCREEADARGGNLKVMRSLPSGLTHYAEAIDEAKAELAVFLNCSPSEVALCDSTTTGMNIFLWGYDFIPGDEIVAGSLENPAARVPLGMIARRRGVKLKYAELGNGELDATDAIAEAISPRTHMILISDVNYATGARVDLRAISHLAHESGILVLADGAQAVGTHPVDVKELGVDGYAMARHKFLCGPDGAGALYVRKEAFSSIHPTYSGVFSDFKHGMGDELALWDTAQRYEVSTRPIPVIKGGTACLRWLGGEVGWSFVFERCRRLYRELWDALSDIHGVRMLSQRDYSGLMALIVEDVSPKEVVTRLRENYIFTRAIEVTEPPSIRLSIGVWNRESDLERIVKAVESIAGSM